MPGLNSVGTVSVTTASAASALSSLASSTGSVAGNFSRTLATIAIASASVPPESTVGVVQTLSSNVLELLTDLLDSNPDAIMTQAAAATAALAVESVTVRAPVLAESVQYKALGLVDR